MGKLNIVLIEPQIPQNTGNIARTCAATGASLHLVEPMGFKVDDKKLKRAGLDYWYLLDITYYDSTEDFFEKNKDGKFFYFTTKGQKIFTETEFPENCYIVFGREDAGLPESLLKENPEKTIKEIVKKSPIPLVADIHFDYRLALQCIENGIQALRINPGNIGKREHTTITRVYTALNIF